MNNINTVLLLFMLSMAAIVVPITTTAVFAQEDESDSEGEDSDGNNSTTLAGGIADAFDVEDPTLNMNNTTTGTPQNVQQVGRAEYIDDNAIVHNPGGANNENINLAGEESMGRTTNLQQIIEPQNIQTEDYIDFEIQLRGNGYAIADMQPTTDVSGIPVIIVTGIPDVIEQPNHAVLNGIAEQYGYYVDTHTVIANAWQTTFKSITGN